MRFGRNSGDDDLAAVRAVRAAIPSDAALMSACNQVLSRHSADERCHQLEDEGLYLSEEPIRHDDYAGELAAQLRPQIGGNLGGPRAMSAALAADASDLLMADLDRIGGVTGWLEAAAIAEVAGTPLSSHPYPEVSAHLLDDSPTAR